MSVLVRNCICCGQEYFGRGKDSLCERCDGSYWMQSDYGFTFEKVDSIFYDWKPTEAYLKATGRKLENKASK